MPSVIRIPTEPTPPHLVKPKITLHRLVLKANRLMQRIAEEEKRYDQMLKKPLSEIVILTAPVRWGVDSKCVRWNGQTFYFTPEQASIVRCLRAEYEKGTPRVKVERLKQLAGSDADELPNIFRVSKERHPAIGVMIHLQDGWWWIGEAA